MDGIIATAEMSTGGVYRYCASRAAIISAIASTALCDVTAGLDVATAAGPDDSLQRHGAFGRVFRSIDAIGDATARSALQVRGEVHRDPEIASLVTAEAEKLQAAVVTVVTQVVEAGELPRPRPTPMPLAGCCTRWCLTTSSSVDFSTRSISRATSRRSPNC